MISHEVPVLLPLKDTSQNKAATALLTLEESLSSEVASSQMTMLQEIKVHLKSCKAFK